MIIQLSMNIFFVTKLISILNKKTLIENKNDSKTSTI